MGRQEPVLKTAFWAVTVVGRLSCVAHDAGEMDG